MHLDDALPVTVLLPESSSDPIVIYDAHAALRVAIVERDAVRNLSALWDQPGVYILLDPRNANGTWGAYVGKAPSGVKNRVTAHVRGKDHWNRAVLILRDTTHGFNSAQAGWLEGRIYDLLNSAADAWLHNEVRPGDGTLPAFEHLTLEATIRPIGRILRLVGHDAQPVEEPQILATPTPAPVGDTARGNRTSEYSGFTVGDLLVAGVIQDGQELVPMSPAWHTVAVVTNGRIVVNGKKHSHLSAAGRAVNGGVSINGWSFWAVNTPNGKVPLAVLRAKVVRERQSGTSPV